MSTQLTRLNAVLLVAAALVACEAKDDAISAPLPGQAELKFVHASATAGPVDVYVGGNKVISGVPFGRSSANAPVTAGRQRVTLRSGTSIVDEIDASIAARQVTAIILTEDSAQATPVLPDTGVAPINNRANIRIVNVDDVFAK